MNVLSKNGLIDLDDAVDYAGGYGTLSKILKKYLNTGLSVYDPLIQDAGQDFYIQLRPGQKFNLVITSALFEHLTTRALFDEINELVTDSGCLFLHTLVCENVPKDPDWFYIEPPVHCAVHTNKSMSLLMEQWNYQSSLYCPAAKSWVLFKEDKADIQAKIEAINKEFQTEYIIYKKGFVDYWKGF